MSKNAKQTPVVLVQANGQLELKNFTARTFAQALKNELPKNWRTSPKALAKCVKNTPDLLTLTLGIMGSFEEMLWDERQEVEERIRVHAEALEAEQADQDKVKSDAELDELYDTLKGYDERLWALEELAPHKWIKSLSSLEYLAVVFSVEQFLEQTMTESWTLFCAHKDNAKLATVHAFRLLPLEVLDALQVEFVELTDASLPIDVCTRLTAAEANTVAKKFKLKLAFEAVEPAPKKRTRKSVKTVKADVAAEPVAETKAEAVVAVEAPKEAPVADVKVEETAPTVKKPAARTTKRTTATKSTSTKTTTAKRATAAKSTATKTTSAKAAAPQATEDKPTTPKTRTTRSRVAKTAETAETAAKPATKRVTRRKPAAEAEAPAVTAVTEEK